jgi:hypothetical protein
VLSASMDNVGICVSIFICGPTFSICRVSEASSELRVLKKKLSDVYLRWPKVLQPKVVGVVDAADGGRA